MLGVADGVNDRLNDRITCACNGRFAPLMRRPVERTIVTSRRGCEYVTHSAIVEHIIDAIRRGDANSYVEFFTHDAVFENPLAPEASRGRDAIRDSEQALFDSFSDVQIDIRSLTVDAPRVVAEVILRATNTGAIDIGQAEPVPPTGRRIEISAAWVFEFAPNGRVAAERDYFDSALLIEQLGIGS